MLKQANETCARLWRDESGVALAVTVVVFLTVFMMAFSVFAVGETVRQRIEIQNAADAAAYSAAIAQADTLSRLAAINRAMAWTYTQMVRMDMDAIVDKWLEIVLERWEVDYLAARAVAAASTCAVGPFTGSDDWYAGRNYGQREHVRINRDNAKWIAVERIRQERAKAAAAGKSWSDLKPHILEYREIVKAMNEAQADLMDSMPQRIADAVEDVLLANVADTENDLFAGGADFMYALIHEENRKKLFEELENNEKDEAIFLHYGSEDVLFNTDALPEPYDYFDAGSDDGEWFVRSDSGKGIHRTYRQRYKMLVADWYHRGRTWVTTGKKCVVMPALEQHSEVLGEEGLDNDYYETERCFPHRLKKEFFAEQGALVVGVARRVNNPLRFLYDSDAESGIFRPFTLDEGERFMWAVAAARAAHHRMAYAAQPPPGEYDPTFWKDDLRHWNLKYSDWDATLLPLHRAWAQGENLAWNGESGGAILSELRNGSWQPLYGGGGALGAQGAPRLMNQGAALNYGSAEHLILH